MSRWHSRISDILGIGPAVPHAWLLQDREDNCSQTVLSMLTGLSVDEISGQMGRTGSSGITESVQFLHQQGFACWRPMSAAHVAEFWAVYRQRSGGRRLRGLAFTVAREGQARGHAWLLHGNYAYDPGTGRFEALNEERLRGFDYVVFLSRQGS